MRDQKRERRPGAGGGAGNEHVGHGAHRQYNAPSDPVQAFCAALADAGIPPHSAANVVADGRLHRYRVEGDRPGTRNGWYVLHLDGVPAGAYGSWRAGVSGAWRARDSESLTPAEREAHRQRMEASRAERDRERHQRWGDAAETARTLWARSRPTDPAHPYLTSKGVTGHCARQHLKTLFLPVCSLDGTLWSLQFIESDGRKTLLRGGRKRGLSIPVSEPPDARRVVIAEGFATAATLAAHYNDALVLAAIDAGNLEPVALTVRQRWPSVELIVAGDDDRQTRGNPGATKAEAAARAAQGHLVLPEWSDDAPDTLTDFNDLALWLGRGRHAA